MKTYAEFSMSLEQVNEWLTEERVKHINHDRWRAGMEEQASKELLAKIIASMKGRHLREVIARYE